jgi:hypothetical protein
MQRPCVWNLLEGMWLYRAQTQFLYLSGKGGLADVGNGSVVLLFISALAGLPPPPLSHNVYEPYRPRRNARTLRQLLYYQ